MDNRANLRRLNDLGVSGHQPAIMAFCQMSKWEKAQITEAILKQKVANDKKTDALYVGYRERQNKSEESEQAAKAFEEQGNRILLRIARIATGIVVRWKRETKTNDRSEM